MTIKLNEFDKKLLSQITPSSKGDKLKSIYAINSVVKQLKIGNKKIGQKCAKHLQKLSKQDSTNINEIRKGCVDLRIKKQKHGLAKDKTKKDVLKEHTKLDVGQEKPQKSKVKPKPPTQPSATQQLVNLFQVSLGLILDKSFLSNSFNLIFIYKS